MNGTNETKEFRETAYSQEDENIRYWIFELEMPQEDADALERIAKEHEMTVDELFEKVLLFPVRHPEETAQFFREQHPDADCRIRLVRQYPVHKGETEAQARERAIAEEALLADK